METVRVNNKIFTQLIYTSKLNEILVGSKRVGVVIGNNKDKGGIESPVRMSEGVLFLRVAIIFLPSSFEAK